MTVAALSHGYPPLWNMGGEVSLHRTMKAIREDKVVLTATDKPYTFEGVRVENIDTPNVLDIRANPRPIAAQLRDQNARIVIGQNELSLAAVRAADMIDAISIVNIHTPPRYGANLREAMRLSDYAIYNTQVSAKEWGEPDALVLHPPISPLPQNFNSNGDAYTLLSSLRNKGVEVVLNLAAMYPDKRFIIVRSPAEPTHGIPDLEARAALLPNVELKPRVPPEEVYKYLEQTRILLVPSRYETYGMSTIEAAGYGIPTVHVDTPHVREGIGSAAILVPALDTNATAAGIEMIEGSYGKFSENARLRAEWLQERQDVELDRFANFIASVDKPQSNSLRRRAIDKAGSRYHR